jgi:hypothetical protein
LTQPPYTSTTPRFVDRVAIVEVAVILDGDAHLVRAHIARV